MAVRYFAHTKAGSDAGWEPLEEHLDKVAALAAEFGAAFDSAAWCRLAGLWHDVGKYREGFQRKLHGERVEAPHAGAGAALAYPIAPPLAFAIAGHHTGLANHSVRLESTQRPLQEVVSDNAPVLEEIRRVAPASLLQHGRPALPEWMGTSKRSETQLRIEFWTRFVFSALVDADRLATEAYDQPGRRQALVYDDLRDLAIRVDAKLDAFPVDSPINGLRRRVLDRCRLAAAWPPGLFSLTAPTGAGKTLASMSFALRHAVGHAMRRVIVVAPYTSIIEQNAEAYRDVLGPDNVIEHHSAIDESARERELPEAEIRRRLAIENWDAPVVVTTAVQFFETLFNNRPSRCRKLHNVARSVVLIDEAQTLPSRLLLTILDGMRQLTSHYGCSLLLSTATQPALRARAALPQGLEGVREIVEDPPQLASQLRRVSVTWPGGEVVTSYAAVAEAMLARRQVLAIVHRRADARRLAELLADGRFHLSRFMCAAHRSETINRVRKALTEKRPCRVVSTQLIEAGVDVDFPSVFRAMAGLDSLAQAAGRCNRNGSMTDARGESTLGEFVVFRAESSPPRGVLSQGLAVAAAMLSERGTLELTDPDLLEEYFRRLYLGAQLDERDVMAHRRAFDFATVAQCVEFIEKGARPLVVPWGSDWQQRVAEFTASLRTGGTGSRRAARALQPLVVEVYERDLRRLEAQGAAVPLEGFGHVLAAPFLHLYHREFGLTIDDDAAADLGSLIQ